jgi:predicted AlkP superfamily pyrophosphatase or phosphodiesterase
MLPSNNCRSLKNGNQEMSCRRNILIIIASLTVLLFVPPAFSGSATPRLVLQITVDSLRGDLPNRYYDRLGDNGFRYLWEKGTVYTDAHHTHASTGTAAGHTSLATGATPAVHGVIANIWFDREKGCERYYIEDEGCRILTSGADIDNYVEIDPAQKVANSDGRSPDAIMVTTLSDELAIHSAGQSKIFAVSVKDRGAVPMAGHSGKAFWFSKANGEFVTSSYYYDAYPDWVSSWNARKLAKTYSGKAWTLLHEQDTYLFGDADDRAWETDLAGYGRTFPHKFGEADDEYFTTFLRISPVGDELTLAFAKALITNEKLGSDDVPDYLGISFSSTDYVGHIFGPSSLESEDNILRLDKSLADLFTFVDEHVGLENTLIVLSADHGSPEVPGYLNELGIQSGFVDPKSWEKEPAFRVLKDKFGIDKELIESYNRPYLYLNHAVILQYGLNLKEVEQAIAEELLKFEGVAQAVSSSELREGALPDTLINRAVLNNYNAKHSGDIYLVLEPHWFINKFDRPMVSSSHGSPWRYDTYVPIAFAGMKIPAQHIQRRVHAIDVAPTLATFLGIKPPSGSSGIPLVEIFAEEMK